MFPLHRPLPAKRLLFTSQWHSLSLVSRPFTTFPPSRDSGNGIPRRPADTKLASGASLNPTGAKPSLPRDSLRPLLGIIIAGATLGYATLYFLTPSTTSKFGESIKERAFNGRRAEEWREGVREEDETIEEEKEEIEIEKHTTTKKVLQETED